MKTLAHYCSCSSAVRVDTGRGRRFLLLFDQTRCHHVQNVQQWRRTKQKMRTRPNWAEHSTPHIGTVFLTNLDLNAVDRSSDGIRKNFIIPLLYGSQQWYQSQVNCAFKLGFSFVYICDVYDETESMYVFKWIYD